MQTDVVALIAVFGTISFITCSIPVAFTVP